MAATPRMMAEACIRGAWGLGLLPSSTWSGGRLRTSSLTDGSPRIFPFYHTVFFPFSVPCSHLRGTQSVENTLSINALCTQSMFKARVMCEPPDNRSLPLPSLSALTAVTSEPRFLLPA